MITKQIKYYTTQICFQEIPDEISYTYFLTNCPNRCVNCHSPHLRDDTGTLVIETLDEVLVKQKDRCSCILFMGGDDPAQVDSLIMALFKCQQAGFKTALYSGHDLDQVDFRLFYHLNYLKVGPYIESQGPLNNPTTNQRLYKIENSVIKEDITSRFWRKLDENYN